MAAHQRRIISSPQIIQIAAAVPVSTRTVMRVYDGHGNHYSREQVARAAKRLGLPLPLAISSAALPVAVSSAVGGLEAR